MQMQVYSLLAAVQDADCMVNACSGFRVRGLQRTYIFSSPSRKLVPIVENILEVYKQFRNVLFYLYLRINISSRTAPEQRLFHS
jgi:hypothetical protein